LRVWHLALLVVVMFAMAAVLAPVFQRARETDGGPTCRSKLSQLALAMIMYAQDYDDRLPNSATWMDDVSPYIKYQDLFHCPQDERHKYSYAMNSRLSGAKMTGIPERVLNNVIMLYESDSGRRNANGRLRITDLADPKRHDGGLFFAFAAGHARGFTADRFAAVLRDSATALRGLPLSVRPTVTRQPAAGMPPGPRRPAIRIGIPPGGRSRGE